MQSIIRISKDKYNCLAGTDWPSYQDYLKDSYNTNEYIRNDIRLFERKFRYPINNIDRLINYYSYSQAGQDFFVIALLQGKTNGTYLEIGAGNPVFGNNTFSLEKLFNFTGISIEIDSGVVNDWNTKRPTSNLEICNALEYNYASLPAHFDYLQVDIDPPMNNLLVLEKVLQHITFSVITFEHDVWRKTDETKYVMDASRKLLLNYGYDMIVNNVTIEPGLGKGIGNEPIHFEDWYANPKYITKEIIDTYKRIDYSNNPKYFPNILFK
jgi:hypothetical protein